MYLNIGKFTNTHGIKGEIKVVSKFKYKDKVFNTKDFKVYIGKNYDVFEVESYRVHKGLDMVKFNNINNINDIEHLKGSNIYIIEEDLVLESNEFVNEDLIGLEVIFNEEVVGTVVEIMNNSVYDLLVTDTDKYVPILDNFIEEVFEDAVVIKNAEGLV